MKRKGLQLYIGQTQNGQKGYLTENRGNSHILITGMSGYGKTTLLQKMEFNLAEEGNTVIVINSHATHNKSQIFAPISERYGKLCRQTDAKTGGIPLGLLSPIKMGHTVVESEKAVVNSLVNTFGRIKRLGYQQKKVLRTAICYAMKNPHKNDLEAIATGLLKQNDKVADSVYENFYELFDMGKFYSSSSFVCSGYINILDLSGFDTLTQQAIAELIISMVWRYMQVIGTQAVKNVCLVLDEFQNFNLQKDSTLAQILQEGRKFHVTLLLSTQTLSPMSKDKRALIEQAATKVYFRQTYVDGIGVSKRLGVNNWKQWHQIVTALPVGNYLVDGDLEIAGFPVKQPIILH